MESLSNNIEQTKEIAYRIASNAKVNDIFILEGDLGAGKTTFTKYFVEYFDQKVRVQSPTFVIIRKYKINSNPKEIKTINHIDLYRIENFKDVETLDLVELFAEPNSITLIEWPQIAANLLPTTKKLIKFEYLDENKRKITLN